MRENHYVDVEKAQKIVCEIIELYGVEESIALMLMCMGNLTKYLAEICNKYEKDFWEKIKNDDLTFLFSRQSLEMFKCRIKKE